MEKGNWKIDLDAHRRLSAAPARKCAALEAGKWKREIGKSISTRIVGCPLRQRGSAPFSIFPFPFSDSQNKKGSGPLWATALPGVCPRSV
jgi:hypothetical protein